MHAIPLATDEPKFAQAVAHAADDREPVIVTRVNGEAAVIVALSDWNAMQETVYLLSDPENAARLREGIRALDAGEGVERELSHP